MLPVSIQSDADQEPLLLGESSALGTHSTQLFLPAIAAAHESVNRSCSSVVWQWTNRVLIALSLALCISLIVLFCVSNPAGWLSTFLGVSVGVAKGLLGSVTGLSGIVPLVAFVRWCRQRQSSSFAREQLQKVGGSKTPGKESTDENLIARTVMRCPNQKTKQALFELHKEFRDQMLCLGDQYTEWLLDGSSPDARGGFKNITSFRAFLSADPKTLPPSRLITGLSIILHAVAYRAVQSTKSKPPYTYPLGWRLTQNDKAIEEWLRTIMGNRYTIPFVDSRYPDHGANCCASKSDTDSFQTTPPEDDSDISDDEEAEPYHYDWKALPFKTKRPDGNYTWVGSAHVGGIQVWSTISNSTVLALRVLASLGRTDSETIELLAGTLIVPIYHRANYHTIAEIGAAVHHFHDERSASPTTNTLTPKQSLAKGLELMTKCVDSKYRGSVKTLSQHILSKTTDVGYTP